MNALEFGDGELGLFDFFRARHDQDEIEGSRAEVVFKIVMVPYVVELDVDMESQGASQ